MEDCSTDERLQQETLSPTDDSGQTSTSNVQRRWWGRTYSRRLAYKLTSAGQRNVLCVLQDWTYPCTSRLQ